MTTKGKARAKTSKTISPFKDVALFEKEIKEFANKFKTTVVEQSRRISDYFEMSCFNYVVKFYELHGYELKVKNLQSNQYKYKCSPAGIQSNFSHFEAIKVVDGKKYVFEIQHNLAVQSSHSNLIFTCPDISIIKVGKVKTTTDYYETKRRFSFVNNSDLITFCEVKQFTPFPELLFNFIGVLNELKPEYLSDGLAEMEIPNIAPSLMISGKPNKQTSRIRQSLEDRYGVNLIYDLFYTGSITFSKSYVSLLRRARIKVK